MSTDSRHTGPATPTPETTDTRSARPATAQVTQLEQALWQQFTNARRSSDFYQSWLALQCHHTAHCTRAVLVLGTVDTGPYAPAAYWPDNQGGSGPLASLAEQTLAAGKGMVLHYELPGAVGTQAGRHGVAYPILIDGHLHGVVALEVMPRAQAGLQAVMRQLQWASGWLEAWLRKRQAADDSQVRDRLVSALDLVAASLEQESYAVAAKSFVTEMATQLGCERVSIGFVKRGHARVEAVSHSAQFGRQMNLIRAIAAAMDEVVDQQAVIQYPPRDDQEPYVDRNHQQLVESFATRTVVTLPLIQHGRVQGALCLERSTDEPFDPATIELCRSVAAVVAPVLEEKRRNDRWLPVKIGHSLYTQLSRLLGPHYVLRKLIVILLIAAGGFFYQATGEYTVRANTVLEGSVQRVVVSPFDGYVADARVRAGDVVKQDDVLALLDDRELKLEHLKWTSQRTQLHKQYDEALAKRDRAQINILSAQVDQAEAQLALINEQLARTRITAPFAGVIISGDLDQSLGASIRRGDVLFEIAPLESYRIILKVNEHDINAVTVEQRGELVLSAMPDAVIPFTVQRITPVSTAEEGENYFRVEASPVLDASVQQQELQHLRPGMEGAGKISIDERKLAWIWSHDLINRLRLWIWRWLP